MFGGPIENDYIMRQIQQLGVFLANIMGFKQTKQYEMAVWTIEQAYDDIFHLNPQTIGDSTGLELFEHLLKEGFHDPDHHLALATLLKEEGSTYEPQQRMREGYDRYLKSLEILLESVRLNPELDLAEHHRVIEIVENKLSYFELPWPTRHALFQYYEKKGDFAKAEDLLFELTEDNPAELDVAELTEHFYRRLLAKSDEELEKGNLPREEIEDSLANLSKV